MKNRSKDERINVGSLKLWPAEAEKFREAIEHYGYEGTALFLRRAALALIKHHAQGDQLKQPLALEKSGDERHNLGLRLRPDPKPG